MKCVPEFGHENGGASEHALARLRGVSFSKGPRTQPGSSGPAASNPIVIAAEISRMRGRRPPGSPYPIDPKTYLIRPDEAGQSNSGPGRMLSDSLFVTLFAPLFVTLHPNALTGVLAEM